MSFEKNEALTRTYRKNKFNSRIANNNEQKNIEENDSKRSRNEREEDNREKNRNRERDRDNSRDERDDHKKDRENHNNLNNESIQKKAWNWFNNQSNEKQKKLRTKKICFECDNFEHNLWQCSKNSELESKNEETSKN